MSASDPKKRVEGVVKSASMEKTISVVVKRLVKHPKYGKYLKKQSIFKAHDENNDARKGDRVEIVSARPMSKSKHWRLTKVLKKSSGK